jgi:hypothetical protein
MDFSRFNRILPLTECNSSNQLFGSGKMAQKEKRKSLEKKRNSGSVKFPEKYPGAWTIKLFTAVVQ